MSYIDELYEKIEMFIENNLDEYVLSIDGNWGSGKTYAINKVIESYNKKNEKKIKYISLNGIESLSLSNLGIEKFSIMDALEIPALIADNLLPVNASDILEKTKDTFKKEKVKSNIKVIVFDDIERCKCDIDSILGFIDQIKNNGIKVIAVLNSDKIKSENKEIYEKIKEKIIGTIIKWNASDEVINDFIKNIEIENFDKENIKLLKTCLEELYSQFFINNNGEKDINLRLLKKVIIHACYIIKYLNWNKNIGQNYKCAYTEIIKNVYVHFHKETYEDFKDDSDLTTNTSKKLKSSVSITKIDLLFVEDYFNNGLYVNKGKYEKELKLLLEDDKEEFNLKYNKLYSSSELASFYHKMKNNLLADRYPIYSYSNIIRSILTIDFYNKSNYLKEITDIMCNKIENNTEVIYNFDIHYQISEKQNKYILNVKKALGKSNKEISLQLLKKIYRKFI